LNALAGAILATKEAFATLEELDACEDYFIEVGVLGPGGVGPLSGSPLSTHTPPDPLAPPKDVSVGPLSLKDMLVQVSWRAPCDLIQQPLTYNVSLRAFVGIFYFKGGETDGF
jgi:hypothetical protein